MSREILHMIMKLDVKEFERQLALQCAPVIAGIKISNLLVVGNHNEKLLEDFIRGTEMSYFRFLSANQKTTYLLFRRKELDDYLKDEKVRTLLNDLGYADTRLEIVLANFQKKYQTYMDNHIEFPHEMGLLLGYPVEDVLGFILNDGQKFLYSGYWKVYEDLHKKVQLFKSYEDAQTEQVRMLISGMTLDEIFMFYATKNQELFMSAY